MSRIICLRLGSGAMTALCAAGLWAVAVNAAEPEPRAPQVIYERTCGYCHGRNVGPIILGRGISEAVTEHRVRNGMGAMMPFRPTEISNAELAALARWINQSKADETEFGR